MYFWTRIIYWFQRWILKNKFCRIFLIQIIFIWISQWRCFGSRSKSNISNKNKRLNWIRRRDNKVESHSESMLKWINCHRSILASLFFIRLFLILAVCLFYIHAKLSDYQHKCMYQRTLNESTKYNTWRSRKYDIFVCKICRSNLKINHAVRFL